MWDLQGNEPGILGQEPGTITTQPLGLVSNYWFITHTYVSVISDF
jgi:hypothetical protein